MEREKTAPRIGRRLAKLRSFKFWEIEPHATIFNTHRHGDTARSRQRGHRPDGAEAIPEGADARRIRANPFLRLALPPWRKAQPGICLELSALQRRFGLAGARQLRLWLQ